jgi:hypothetical protein
LKEQGYHRHVARKCPWLKPEHKKACKAYGKRYGQWKKEEFWKVGYSDECYIYMDDCHGRIFVTQHEDEEWDEDCIVPTFTQSSVRVMVWGCVFRGQKGLLIVLEYPGGKQGGMTAKHYQEQVLEGVLLDFWEEMKVMKGDIMLQQDNAAAH